MGCFWRAERLFWQAPGVHTTAVGYAGGSTPNPTYEEVCSGRTGHAEVVPAVFDPSQTTYDELLRIFWEGHDPTQGMRHGNERGVALPLVVPVDRGAVLLASRDMFQAELGADHRSALTRRGASAEFVWWSVNPSKTRRSAVCAAAMRQPRRPRQPRLPAGR